MRTSVFCERCATVVAVEADGDGACPICGAGCETGAGCDVFISYATPNFAVAQQVVSGLAAAGIRPWLAPERIGTGEDFLEVIAPALLEARVVVLILSAAAVKSVWVRREVTDAVSRGCPVLPLRIEDFAIPRAWKILLLHNQWEDTFREAFDTHIDRLVARVQAKLRERTADALQPPLDIVPTPIAPAPLEGVNPDFSPYAGPRPFAARMADRFYGREREAAELLKLIRRSRVVLVYAPSGAGKTSLLNTLVCQTLEDEQFDVLLGVRVGGALPDPLRGQPVANVYSLSAVYSLDSATVPSPGTTLTGYLRATARRAGTGGRVLVFDQFEELFTQHTDRFEDRVKFFEDLVAALEGDSSLRVVFAMRKEYYADIEPLAARLPAVLAMQRFLLRRIAVEGALDAVVRPAARYATFAPGVAEKIVEQLNTITVRGNDGVPANKPAEFIELVHLQIVCAKLWAGMPRGITQVEMTHLDGAGDGQTFDAFVANALHAFYTDTIQKVLDSDITRVHGGYSEELLRLGCMNFVTAAGTRTMIRRTKERTGRLPNWIVDQLESGRLLRADMRGGLRWYELAHDRLTSPLPDSSTLRSVRFCTPRTCSTEYSTKHSSSGATSRGTSVSIVTCLSRCQPFAAQSGLFAEEAELLLRASLVSGYRVCEWSRRVRTDFQAVHRAVLEDALRADSAAVRGNAVRLLGEEDEIGLEPALVARALDDADASVREAAAVSLVQRDDPELYRGGIDRLAEHAKAQDALSALSRMRATADPAGAGAESARPRSRDYRVHSAAAFNAGRACSPQRAVPVLPFVFVPAAFFAATTAAAFKWLPSMFNYAVVQATPSAGMGAFHGVIAGVIWAGMIVLGLRSTTSRTGASSSPRSYTRPVGAIVAGAASGLFGSLLIVVVIASVYEFASLERMAWIASADVPGGRLGLDFWRDLFARTRRVGPLDHWRRAGDRHGPGDERVTRVAALGGVPDASNAARRARPDSARRAGDRRDRRAPRVAYTYSAHRRGRAGVLRPAGTVTNAHERVQAHSAGDRDGHRRRLCDASNRRRVWDRRNGARRGLRAMRVRLRAAPPMSADGVVSPATALYGTRPEAVIGAIRARAERLRAGGTGSDGRKIALVIEGGAHARCLFSRRCRGSGLPRPNKRVRRSLQQHPRA